MSEFIRLQANGADAYPDASTENTYRPNGTSVESALVNLESNVTTLGGVAGEAKTLAEQNSVKIATAEREISDINSSLENLSGVKISIPKATKMLIKGVNLFTWNELKLNIDYNKIIAINGTFGGVHSLISGPVNDTGEYDISYALRIAYNENGIKIISNSDWGERETQFIIFHF